MKDQGMNIRLTTGRLIEAKQVWIDFVGQKLNYIDAHNMLTDGIALELVDTIFPETVYGI